MAEQNPAFSANMMLGLSEALHDVLTVLDYPIRFCQPRQLAPIHRWYFLQPPTSWEQSVEVAAHFTRLAAWLALTCQTSVTGTRPPHASALEDVEAEVAADCIGLIGQHQPSPSLRAANRHAVPVPEAAKPWLSSLSRALAAQGDDKLTPKDPWGIQALRCLHTLSLRALSRQNPLLTQRSPPPPPRPIPRSLPSPEPPPGSEEDVEYLPEAIVETPESDQPEGAGGEGEEESVLGRDVDDEEMFGGAKRAERPEALSHGSISRDVWLDEAKRVGETHLSSRDTAPDRHRGPEWRQRLSVLQQHAELLQKGLPEVQLVVSKCGEERRRELERISRTEHHINSISYLKDMREQLRLNRMQQDQVLGRLEELRDIASILERELASRTAKAEQCQAAAERERERLSDSTPVDKLAATLRRLKDEIREMDVRTELFRHTLAQSQVAQSFAAAKREQDEENAI